MENKKTIERSTESNGDITLVKSRIAFLRTIKNKKNYGYVTIVGLKNNAHDQCFMFDTFEDAEEFHDGILEEIGENRFLSYENDSNEVVSIEINSIAFVRGTNDRNGPGKMVIIGLSNSARNQNEFFDIEENYKEFMKMMTKEISK